MRTECLYGNEILHIADFFTTKNGMQIAIEGEIEKLRGYGRKGLLICCCGCGGKLTLVAGKNMKRRQHFRLKDGQNAICKAHEESPITINAKIIIKCWLDDVLSLQDGEILLNAPINKMSKEKRRFEYSHYVPSKKIGICYEKNETNLNDEKVQLMSTQNGVTNICITDIKNDGCWGQYPEFGIKVQKVQGYYALLAIDDMTQYEEAQLKIVRYEKSYLGMWVQIDICQDKLSRYSFNENNELCLRDQGIYNLVMKRRMEYIAEQKNQKELAKKQEEERRRKEEEVCMEAERKRKEEKERKEKEEEERRAYWERYEKEKRLRESGYHGAEITPIECQKRLTEAEVIEQNPKIKLLKEYISGLKTLGGVFTYVSKKDRSSISRYEKISVNEVKFNPHRNRIEIMSDCKERYIIYLQLAKDHHVNTNFTGDGYLLFSLCDVEEKDVVPKFLQLVECDDEKYVESYVCTLECFCVYKSKPADVCTYVSDDNKCGFRKRVQKIREEQN